MFQSLLLLGALMLKDGQPDQSLDHIDHDTQLPRLNVPELQASAEAGLHGITTNPYAQELCHIFNTSAQYQKSWRVYISTWPHSEH